MKQFLSRNKIILFLVFTFIFSWFPWYTGIAPEVMAAGPSLAAFLIIGITTGREGFKQLFRRFGRWRVGWIIWGIALFGPGLIYLIGLAIYLLFGGIAPPFIMIREELGLIPLYLILVILNPLNGPVGEEFGWRGFALPELQKRFGPLITSLLIGTVWGFWHLPSFFNSQGVVGAIASQIGLVFILIYTLGTVANSIFMTWLYNRSRNSALVAGIIFHAAINFWAPVLLSDSSLAAARDGTHLPTIDPGLYITVLVIQVIAAGILVIATRGNLGLSNPENQAQ